jgi:hypothetical protein
MRKIIDYLLLQVAGLSVSLAALLVSLFLFLYFKSLSCSRISLHKNMFTSLALNNISWIVW